MKRAALPSDQKIPDAAERFSLSLWERDGVKASVTQT